MAYQGDYLEDATVDFKFSTRTTDNTGMATLSGTPALSVYKANGTTESTAGITLSVDFDSVTGLNHVRIDTSADAFYATGADYDVVITTGTVDGVSVVGEVVGSFSIENRVGATASDRVLLALPAAAADAAGGLPISDAGGLDLDAQVGTKINSILDDTDLIDDGTSGLAKIATDVAAILVDTAEIGAAGAGLTNINLPNQTMDIVGNITGSLSGSVGSVTAGVTLADDAITASKFDETTAFPLASADSGSTAVARTGADSDTLETLSDQIDGLSTSAAPQLLQSTTIATLAAQDDFTLTAGSADDDAYNGAIVVVTDQSTSTQKAVGTVANYTGSTKRIELVADPGIFTMATGDTVDILAAISSAPTAAAIRAEIDANSTQLAAIVADTNELQTDLADGGRLDLLVDAIKAKTDSLTFTVAGDVDVNVQTWGGTAISTPPAVNATQISGSGTAADNAEIVFATDFATNYNTTNDGWVVKLGNYAHGGPSGSLQASINGNIVGSFTGNIVGDITGNLSGSVANVTGGINTAAGTITTLDALDTAQDSQHGTTQTAIADLPTNSELATALAAADDAVLAAIAALNNPTTAQIAAAVLTTAMTESYAAQGAAPTLAQFAFIVHQGLFDSSRSGTTWTIKKLDQSTTAATGTFDDATNPTGVARAT